MTARNKEAFLSIGINTRQPVRVGFEWSRVFFWSGPKYLDRFIVYLSGTARLHRFWRGDDDRAPHDHPWSFVTFPFTSYTERYWKRLEFACQDWETGFEYSKVEWQEHTRVVKAWRFHYRHAKFRHIVVGRTDGKDKPFWTLVFSATKSNKWGFWPTPETFVPWREWK